ncbi:MAG TPA: LysM domain-containing protein [Thermodesulfobacteriota bacterium]|nr:LysM domain-containing protein [Thermodesulfobacteriota bacterium]
MKGAMMRGKNLWILFFAAAVAAAGFACASSKPHTLPPSDAADPVVDTSAKNVEEPQEELKPAEPPSPPRPVQKEVQAPAKKPPARAENAPAPASRPEPLFVHTVKWSGETLWIISNWYTGDGKNWRILANASPDINPNRIHEGNRIYIPASVLKKREPMTREFVERCYTKTRKEKTPANAPALASKDEPQLFGPKK